VHARAVLHGDRCDRGHRIAASAVTVFDVGLDAAPPPESDPAMLRIRTGFFIGAYRSGDASPHPTSPARGEGKIRAQSAEVDTGSAKDCATNQKARVISIQLCRKWL